MAAAIDDSCRRPGAIPFKWEICPGTPKHVRSSSASAAPPSSSPFSSSAVTVSKVAVSPKLTPPPAMSPSPYHSPRVSYYSSSASAGRAASVSPSRRRTPHQHRPTAFLDVNPRVAPAYYRAAGAGAGAVVEDDEGVAVAAQAGSMCFPLPAVFRRRDGRKGGRRSSGNGATSSGSGSTSASSFWSDYGGAPVAPGGLRRSVSTSSSSSCLSLSSRSSGKLAEAREVEAAGGWFY